MKNKITPTLFIILVIMNFFTVGCDNINDEGNVNKPGVICKFFPKLCDKLKK